MLKPPHAVQLSRFKAPKCRRGRPYTVDFGIAKPLYKQLLSKLSSGAHPRWKLVTANKARLTAGLLAVYVSAFLPFTANQKIVYADPIMPHSKVLPLAQLVMPAVAAVEPAEELPLPPPPITTTLQPFGTYANSFALYNCTWGVASRLPVTWSGNANEWSANAAAQGYAVSNIPKPNSIAQTSSDSYLGHVAIVLSVNPDGSFVVWEENYYGLGVTDERLTTTAEFPNFIYV